MKMTSNTLTDHEETEVTMLTKVPTAHGAILTNAEFDNTIRWKDGERLEHLFERRCDDFDLAGKSGHPAVVTADGVLSYRELDNRANQVARYLLKQGLRSGDRIALVCDKSLHTYVALLAVLKIQAAYVPIDACFPRNRIDYILSDANVRALVTITKFQDHLRNLAVPVIPLDEVSDHIAAESPFRLDPLEKSPQVSQLCYIIYTSGSTGNPKGVAIEHPSICNFVKVAGEVYGIREDDRMYQGMTIAFDFSVEELWVGLIAGATLVPGKSDTNLVGRDLAEFLMENQVTAMCCVPTLLASIEEDVPTLRALIVSGEACPQDLVARWHRPGRRMLNVYGPTEATVSCTYTELHPDRPVTIGKSLPTYSIVILDEGKPEVKAFGAQGEICVAGIGLAQEYVNRDDLTQKSFIPDFLDIPDNPSRRIYRTGDLGRINEHGEIEFHGRIDTQVKIRGYRIELTEIESVLLQLPEIAQAVVSTYESESGTLELVGYCTLKEGVTELPYGSLGEVLRQRLPRYMIPAYMECVTEIPMLPSHKADRKRLPPPKGPRFVAGSRAFVAPQNEMEQEMASALADILTVDRVSVEDNFFEELGAHSLLMAQFGAEIRKRLHVDVSMRDIYLHPTVVQLTEHVRKTATREEKPKVQREPYRIPSNREYYTCGTLQFLSYCLYALFHFWLLTEGAVWILNWTDHLDLYVRIIEFEVAYGLVLIGLPIGMKWVLIGKWTPQKIPIWSLAYFRFWVVKELIQKHPLAMFKGYPLFNVYLRLLGAKIGNNVVVECKTMPICTDLLSIGDGTIIQKDSIVLGYKAVSNYLYTGPITIGNRAFVGEGTVVEINTCMENDTEIGHASALHEGQTIPQGKHYHGVPAQETTATYCSIPSRNCSLLRRVVYSVFQGSALSFFVTPLIFMIAINGYQEFSPNIYRTVSFDMVLDTVLISAGLFWGLFMFGLLSVFLVPRLLYVFLRENRVYVLYGFHYFVFKLIQSLSNVQFFNNTFGDSSYIVYYLKLVGWDLSKIVQTGSNFGVNQRHEIPFLTKVGSGTMVADGLVVMNAYKTSTSFKLSRTAIGDHNYLGNALYYPPDGKTGRNCLLATKVMVPIDGPVRENVGLLGSPSFEIPRAVNRDRKFEAYAEESQRGPRLRHKNLHNLKTMAAWLVSQWILGFVLLLTVYIAFVYLQGMSLDEKFGLMAIWGGATAFSGIFTLGYFIFLNRVSIGFGRLRPLLVSIYNREFWEMERHWKFNEVSILTLFRGTPFKPMVFRALGTKVGKKVFDDGAFISESTLVEIGDYCTLNVESALQSHSLEEGVFKSDYIRIGRGSTLSCNSFVHYGVTMDENVMLETDSFLMKGEAPETHSTWGGNPAQER